MIQIQNDAIFMFNLNSKCSFMRNPPKVTQHFLFHDTTSQVKYLLFYLD